MPILTLYCLSKSIFISLKKFYIFYLFIFSCICLFIYSWIHTEESERSGMAVLDVTIPTGYWIQQQKLDAYVLSNRVRNLRRAKYMERKIVFYFDYVSIFATKQFLIFINNYIF